MTTEFSVYTVARTLAPFKTSFIHTIRRLKFFSELLLSTLNSTANYSHIYTSIYHLWLLFIEKLMFLRLLLPPFSAAFFSVFLLIILFNIHYSCVEYLARVCTHTHSHFLGIFISDSSVMGNCVGVCECERVRKNELDCCCPLYPLQRSSRSVSICSSFRLSIFIECTNTIIRLTWTLCYCCTPFSA